MKHGPAKTSETSRLTPRNELQASAGMPAELREYVIAKLAEILVLDYQQYQVVTRPTVAEGSACNRRLRGRMASRASGGPSAHDEIGRSPFLQ
jgi:hypothetical protein